MSKYYVSEKIKIETVGKEIELLHRNIDFQKKHRILRHYRIVMLL